MRILQIVHDFPFNNFAGVEIYTYNLSKELSKNNEVFIFYRINNPARKEYEIEFKKDDNLNIYTINNTFKYCYSFKGFYQNEIIDKKFAKILDKIKPDIVHIQHLIFLSISLIYEIKKRAIPIVFTLHDYWLICPQWHFLDYNWNTCKGDNLLKCLNCIDYQLKISKNPKEIYNFFRKFIPKKTIPCIQKIYSKIKNLSFNYEGAVKQLKRRQEIIKENLDKVDFFIAPSMFVRNRFLKFGIPRKKIVFFRYGFDLNLAKNFKKIESKKIRFGFIGTILPAKGLHVLIKAFNKISSNNVFLDIYGNLYPYRDFEKYPEYIIKLIGNNEKIKIKGSFKHRIVGSIFSNIDVLVVPSIWYENCPLVIQEAFLFKTPVIASDIGGIPELVKDRINGILFYPKDVNSLYRVIKEFVDNPNLIEQFKKNINPPKSIKKNADEIKEIYKRLYSYA